MSRKLFIVPSKNYNRDVLDAVSRIEKGYGGICYLTLNKTSSFIKEYLDKKGVVIDKFFFLDYMTTSVFKLCVVKNCKFVDSVSDLSKLAELVLNTVKKNGSGLLIIDSLSSLKVYKSDDELISFVSYVSQFMDSLGVDIVLFALAEDADRSFVKQVGMMVDRSERFK